MSKRQMAAAFTAYLATFHAEKPEKGFFTAEEWGQIMGFKDRQAGNRLRELERIGKVEAKKFRVVCSSVIRPRMYYRIAPDALKALGLTTPKR